MISNIALRKACFIGLGYIGLPTAIIFAKNGFDIVSVDVNPDIVEKTNKGELHVVVMLVARDEFKDLSYDDSKIVLDFCAVNKSNLN